MADTMKKDFVFHRGFGITAKLDFGDMPFLIDGLPCARGYVVTDSDGACNVMPGATWFQTVRDAMQAVDVLIECGGTPVWDSKCDFERFWKTMRMLTLARERLLDIIRILDNTQLGGSSQLRAVEMMRDIGSNREPRAIRTTAAASLEADPARLGP